MLVAAASPPSAGAAIPLVDPAVTGGWSSVLLDAQGDELSFTLAARANGPAAGGMDLFDAAGARILSFRMLADGRSVHLSASSGDAGPTVQLPFPFVSSGGTMTAGSDVSRLGCRTTSMEWWFADRYVLRLGRCSGLHEARAGIMYGLASDGSSPSWELALADGSTITPFDAGVGGIMLHVDDFHGGPAVGAGGPAGAFHAQNATATLAPAHGFFGAALLNADAALGATLEYRSAAGARKCSCHDISEAFGGPREFRLDGTGVAQRTSLAIAGVDARLPPLTS